MIDVVYFFKRITKRTNYRINQYITTGIKAYLYNCTCKLKDRSQELLLATRGCRNMKAKVWDRGQKHEGESLGQGPGRRALPSPPTPKGKPRRFWT